MSRGVTQFATRLLLDRGERPTWETKTGVDPKGIVLPVLVQCGVKVHVKGGTEVVKIEGDRENALGGRAGSASRAQRPSISTEAPTG